MAGLKERRKRVPAMSLTSLHLDGDIPPFFSFVVPGPQEQGQPKLAACGNFDPDKVSAQLKNLAKRQIGGVICLTETCLDKEIFERAEMRLLHIPTPDLTPPTVEQLKEGVDFIADCNEKDKAALVHCAQGIGRTGTMLGAYFIIKEKLPAKRAIEIVRDRRAGSIHKKAQELQLYDLEEAMGLPSSKPPEFETPDGDGESSPKA